MNPNDISRESVGLSTVASIVQMILAAMFTFSAGIKWFRARTMVQHWTEYRYPLWLMDAIASLELIGAAGILLGFWYPALLPYAAALLAIMMIAAIHAHLFRAKHKPHMAVNALLMLALSILLMGM